MYPYDFIENINHRVAEYVGKLEEVTAEALGLDSRSAYRLYIDEDRTCIVVSKASDRTLQYYGGFEYIEKEYRKELGDWVFYFDESERVADCFKSLMVTEEEL